MRPSSHVVAAAGLGVPMYLAGTGPVLAGAAALTMVFMDLDHVVDYLLWQPRPLSWKSFFRPGNCADWPCLTFALHGYEWLLFLAAAAYAWQSPLL